ncbi:hypothetical protein OKW28_007403 [Paraburkholderia sp. 40]
MAAKRKSALRSITSSGIPTLREGLKTQLAPIATALTEELAALLAAALDDGRKTDARPSVAGAKRRGPRVSARGV